MQGRKIIKHFGPEAQKIKSQEEAGEFIVAMAKFINCPNKTTKLHVEEEAVDLLIMLEQVFIILGTKKSTIELQKEYKLNRTCERINNEKKMDSLC